MAAEVLPIVMDANAITTIINNLNSIYNNLISYTVGIILFVGAVVPAAISFFQNRGFKKEQHEIKSQINSEIKNGLKESELKLNEIVKTALNEEIAKITLELNKLKITFEKEISCNKGSAYHLQANQNKQYPELCVDSAKDALECYLAGDDERNARTILSIIITAMKNLDKSMMDDPIDMEKCIEGIVASLNKYNLNGKYDRDIDEINRLFKTAKKLEPKPK